MEKKHGLQFSQHFIRLRLIGIWLTALLLPTPLLAQNEKTKDADTYKEIKELEQRL